MNRKITKKLLAIAFSVMLTIGLLAGCGNTGETEKSNGEVVESSEENVTENDKDTGEKPADPIDMITDGYYTYSYTVDGYGQYDYFFHFYEEDPVLGAVFYAGFVNNKANFVGTYTVEEKGIEYRCAEDRDKLLAEEYITGTAPYTVTFYDWSGTVLGSCGFDGEILYNDLIEIRSSGSEDCFYYHDTDGEASQFAKTYEGEMGMTYLEFVADEDDSCTVSLFHNMTYMDLMGMIVEGSWTMEGREDGGYDYTLVPDSESDTGAVLSVAADQMSAVYTQDGGEPVQMSSTAGNEAELKHVFEGSVTIEEYGADAALTLKLLDDGTCALEADIFDNQAEIDNGTYEMVNDYTFGITFETAGYIETQLDPETTAITLQYAGTTSLGEIDTLLTLNNEATDAAESGGDSAEVLFSFTGGFTTMDILSDNTYTFTYEDYGLEEKGTWAFDAASYQFSITQSNGNVIQAEFGDGNSLNLNYVAEANEALADKLTCDSATWGSALVSQ